MNIMVDFNDKNVDTYKKFIRMSYCEDEFLQEVKLSNAYFMGTGVDFSNYSQYRKMLQNIIDQYPTNTSFTFNQIQELAHAMNVYDLLIANLSWTDIGSPLTSSKLNIGLGLPKQIISIVNTHSFVLSPELKIMLLKFLSDLTMNERYDPQYYPLHHRDKIPAFYCFVLNRLQSQILHLENLMVNRYMIIKTLTCKDIAQNIMNYGQELKAVKALIRFPALFMVTIGSRKFNHWINQTVQQLTDIVHVPRQSIIITDSTNFLTAIPLWPRFNTEFINIHQIHKLSFYLANRFKFSPTLLVINEEFFERSPHLNSAIGSEIITQIINKFCEYYSNTEITSKTMVL